MTGPLAPAGQGAPVPRAVVVFCGGTEPAWTRLLKPGFRHCFVALHDGRHWLCVDPLSTFTDVSVLAVPEGADLADWFRRHGLTAVAAPVVRGLRRPAPWALFTCVEAVKRVLGLRAWWVITPWQLFRHLARHGGDDPAAGPPPDRDPGGGTGPDAVAAVLCPLHPVPA